MSTGMTREEALEVLEAHDDRIGLNNRLAAESKQRIDELEETVADLREEITNLQAEIDRLKSDIPNGKEGNVRSIVAAAMNSRDSDQDAVTLRLEQLDVVTDVTRRRCRQYVKELPDEYAFLHDRADVSTYGEMQKDTDKNGPGLVVDFEGVHGPTGELKRFFDGGTKDP